LIKIRFSPSKINISDPIEFIIFIPIISHCVVKSGISSAVCKGELSDFFLSICRFIRTAEDNVGADSSWEKQMAQKYYNQLFREYCLGDFSRYKEGQVRNFLQIS
jgi:hypothetical protein